MKKHITVEVCCGSINDCMLAQQMGADRIELNHSLEQGGLVPSLGTFLEAKKRVSLPICVMIRPRGSGFCYTEEQFQGMLTDARLFLENGADGIVFGFLHEDGSIDVERTKQMAALAEGKEAVFHKAFDSTVDLEESLKTLIDCGITRVLTSGGTVYPEIIEGSRIIGHLDDLYGDKIQLLPGGGVRAHNAKEVLRLAHTGQIHLTAKNTFTDLSTSHRYPDNDPASLQYTAVGEENLRNIIQQVREYETEEE